MGAGSKKKNQNIEVLCCLSKRHELDTNTPGRQNKVDSSSAPPPRPPARRRPTGACPPPSRSRRSGSPQSTRLGPARTHGRSAVRGPVRSAHPAQARAARARPSGGPGVARDAVWPLAPRPGARHPPAAAPRAACPLFWSGGPAPPP